LKRKREKEWEHKLKETCLRSKKKERPLISKVRILLYFIKHSLDAFKAQTDPLLMPPMPVTKGATGTMMIVP
jgi:hypothetical protein